MPTGPSRPVAPQARWAWRGRLVFAWGVVLGGTTTIGFPVKVHLDLLGWILISLGVFLSVVIVPGLRWRNWRWDVRDEAIEIRHGVLRLRLTRIPMSRVQHVETVQDPIERYLTLANVVVHTAAGRHKVAVLPYDDANLLRSRVSELAQTTDAT